MRIRSNQVWYKRAVSALLIALVTLTGLLALRSLGITDALDRTIWEQRFAASNRPVSGDIVFVDIDARSLDELGVWPVPRSTYARLINQLTEMDVSDIVFDIDFSSVSSHAEDSIFADAIERAGNVSLAAFRQAASGSQATDKEVLNQPIDKFLDVAWPVVVMVPVEADSRIWRNLYGYELSGNQEVSAAAYLGEYSGNALGSFWLDYSIAIDQIPTVSMIDVLNGNVPITQLFGKKVIIGASAQELRDLFPTPVFGMLPGAVIQALGAETLLQDRALQIQGEVLAVVAVFCIFFLFMLSKAEGLGIKIAILLLASISLEVASYMILQERPIMISTASAQFLLFLTAIIIVFRELGLQKLLSQIYQIRQRNSIRMLGQVFDDSFDAIVVLDRKGNVTASSQVARSLFGLKDVAGEEGGKALPEELVEEAVAVLSLPIGIRPVPKQMSLIDEDGNHRIIEYVVTRSEKAIEGRTTGKTQETEALACLTCRDITEQQEATERLSYLAKYDPVTGLVNRNGFEEVVAQRVSEMRASGDQFCMVQVAISNLDQIIASLGYSYGDMLRSAIAQRLQRHFGQSYAWGALTADVFAGAFPERENSAFYGGVVQEIREVFSQDYMIEGSRIAVQLNAGYIVDDGTFEVDDFLKKSGNALARARRNERVEVVTFQPKMNEELHRRRELEMELFKSISRDELRMFYQPLVDLQTRNIIGVEALLRWRHGELGEISPAEFVPISEENGFIVELGTWVLNRAMREAASWGSSIRLAINVSALQFSRGDIVSTIHDALHTSGFPAQRLDLEITESLFIDETIDLRSSMEELRDMGCRFSLDDFGTGYSSLGYIPNYPFSKIKLDRMFITNVSENKKDVALIEAVLHMADAFGMETVMEGVETEEQARTLTNLGCRIGQGYLFAKPMSASDLNLMIKECA
ncbi:EAL domain-containing protein [Roseibium sp.]|uniref:EAL domain-containing protein n=1 Tax=Roseibium sp. TaxID=1936156 RepID=UPI003B528099